MIHMFSSSQASVLFSHWNSLVHLRNEYSNYLSINSVRTKCLTMLSLVLLLYAPNSIQDLALNNWATAWNPLIIHDDTTRVVCVRFYQPGWKSFGWTRSFNWSLVLCPDFRILTLSFPSSVTSATSTSTFRGRSLFWYALGTFRIPLSPTLTSWKEFVQ